VHAMSINDARKEPEDGSALRHSPAPMAGGMSGCPRALRAGAAAFAPLQGAFCCDLLPPSTRSACPALSLWPARGGGTPTYRLDRGSLWTRPPAPATFYWLGSGGRWALAPGVNTPRRRALRPSRGGLGVRSLRLPQVWDRVGRGGAPVGGPSGQGRPLASRRLRGLRVGRRPYPGRHAAVCAPSMDDRPGPPGHSRGAPRPAASGRGRRGGPTATRSGSSSYATATATTSRWCRAMVLCPTRCLGHHGSRGPGWPKPHSAAKHAASVARVQLGERTMRSVIGRGGLSTTRCRYSPHGFG
jgi:hypothetical protein